MYTLSFNIRYIIIYILSHVLLSCIKGNHILVVPVYFIIFFSLSKVYYFENCVTTLTIINITDNTLVNAKVVKIHGILSIFFISEKDHPKLIWLSLDYFQYKTKIHRRRGKIWRLYTTVSNMFLSQHNTKLLSFGWLAMEASWKW